MQGVSAEPSQSQQSLFGVSLAWVAGQVVLIGAVALCPRGLHVPLGIPGEIVSWVMVVVGVLVIGFAAINLGDALTPLPVPSRSSTLTRGGLYGLVRHPIYSGLLLLCCGVAVGREGVANVGAFVALYLFLYAKARYEERLLHERYSDYAEYARETPRFFPRCGAGR